MVLFGRNPLKVVCTPVEHVAVDVVTLVADSVDDGSWSNPDECHKVVTGESACSKAAHERVASVTSSRILCRDSFRLYLAQCPPLLVIAITVREEFTIARTVEGFAFRSLDRTETYYCSVFCNEFRLELRKNVFFHLDVTAVFYLQSTRLSVGQPTPYPERGQFFR